MSYSFESNETHDVKIGDVKPLEKHLNVVFKVLDREAEREINNRSGETHRVCDLTVADETGSIVLTLWNEDIDTIADEKVYKLTNGFANIFRNSLRLSKGKFGSVAEDQTVFAELNSENNRSSDHIEDPRRRSYDDRRSSYGSNRSSYGDNRSSGGYGSNRRDNQSSGRRKRW
jgi:replication factor A1